VNPLRFVKLVATLSLLGTITLPGRAGESTVFLKPPGLRLIKDPSTIIPALYHYPNQTLILPDYRGSFGRQREGWAMEVIKTRRFFSHQSARLFFRTSDLARSTVFKASGPSRKMRLWPLGTLMILEIYEGNASLEQDAKPIKIAAMAKMEDSGNSSLVSFYPIDWSYATFTPGGEPSLVPDKVKECHRCHTIAFHLTGDLIFTQFPRE
jgi:hypothetical protein